MKLNLLRRDCYNHCCRKIRKREAPRRRNASTIASVTSDVSASLPISRLRILRTFSELRGHSNLRLNSTPKSIGIGKFPSIDYAYNVYPYQSHAGRYFPRPYLRNYSTNIDEEDNNLSLTLQNAAFASKDIVERRFLQSIETSIWKSSNEMERKKMYQFFFPQMRKVSNDLLSLTSDVEALSDSIERARQSNEPKTSEEHLIRQLHSSFLQLTQMVMDILDVAMKSERASENPSHSLEMLELVLSLSYRTHQLGFDYHRPLYQRLALIVAKHPMITVQNTEQETSTTLGSLVRQSRAEWIQAIHRWLRSDWNCAKNDNQSLERKHEDVEWFHPSLQALAIEGHWTDVYSILVGLLRYDPEPGVDDDSFLSDYDEDFDDSVVIASAITVPYLSEDLVFDLLVPMDRQGRLRSLWNHSSIHSPLDVVLENIIVMMEPSIWRIFHEMPSHHKSTTSHSVKYNLRDAIETLLKYGSNNSKESYNVVDDAQAYFSNDDEEDSLAKALGELENILDEHLDVSSDGEKETDGINDPGSDSVALATALVNQVEHDGIEDKIFNSLNAERVIEPLQESETPMGQPYSEDVLEKTSLDEGVQETKERFIDNLVGEEYMDFIYDDRATDYQDNIPDIMNQVYQSNGNQQLRYSIGLEYQIFEGLRRPELHFDDEDDYFF